MFDSVLRVIMSDAMCPTPEDLIEKKAFLGATLNEEGVDAVGSILERVDTRQRYTPKMIRSLRVAGFTDKDLVVSCLMVDGSFAVLLRLLKWRNYFDAKSNENGTRG